MTNVLQTAAWSAERVDAFEAAFMDFLANVKIVSKEFEGAQSIRLYGSQRLFLRSIFDGLRKDIRAYYFLKARQVGVSTVSFLLSIFYASVFPGIQGALIFDNDKNKEKFRTLLGIALGSLPETHQIGIKKNNRDGLVFENDSTLDFLVAGEKKTTTSANLGQGKAYNFVHATECGSWADKKGLKSLERALSQRHPNRLFIFESRANGFNIWRGMWLDAQADDLTKCAAFIGWWSNDIYSYEKGSLLYARYSAAEITKEEAEKIQAVFDQHGHEITMEQLSWYRHQKDPTQSRDTNSDDEDDDGYTDENLPWTADDAFVISGSLFFPTVVLTRIAQEIAEKQYRGFRYHLENDFFSMKRLPVNNAKDATLKLWEMPNPNGIYVIGADPAFASNEASDRYVAQILRVYADGTEQVGEYCERNIETHHFAWILLDLCGMFQNARFLLEINGPGEAVWQAMCEMKLAIRIGYMKDDAEAAGLKNIMTNVRSYIWSRPDAVERGTASYHYKTDGVRKFSLMTNLKSDLISGSMNLSSLECIDEMQHIVQQGTSIAASGKRKDDRVIALALANQAWHDAERKRLIAQNYTRELAKRSSMSQEEIMRAYSGDIVRKAMARRQFEAKEANRALSRGSRWNW